jgi:hypothetical protein
MDATMRYGNLRRNGGHASRGRIHNNKPQQEDIISSTSNPSGAQQIDVLALARAAGLDKAVEQFPEDVRLAAQSAARARGTLPALDHANAETWPPMRIRSPK